MKNYKFNRVSRAKYIKAASRGSKFGESEKVAFAEILCATGLSATELPFLISAHIGISPTVFDRFVDLFFYSVDFCYLQNKTDTHFERIVNSILDESADGPASFEVMLKFFLYRLLALPSMFEEHRDKLGAIYRNSCANALQKQIESSIVLVN